MQFAHTPWSANGAQGGHVAVIEVLIDRGHAIRPKSWEGAGFRLFMFCDCANMVYRTVLGILVCIAWCLWLLCRHPMSLLQDGHIPLLLAVNGVYATAAEVLIAKGAQSMASDRVT